MNAEERCALICRTAQFVFDNTDTWRDDGMGDGLAYLLWGIADGRPGMGFDPLDDEKYDGLLKVLRANPNGLYDELVSEGFLVKGACVDE